MPESSQSATDASLQVGAVELTPRPTVAANVIMIEATAHATTAPATIGVHCSVHESSTGRSAASASISTVSILIAAVLAKAEERQNGHDDHDQADKINQAVHGVLLLKCECSLISGRGDESSWNWLA